MIKSGAKKVTNFALPFLPDGTTSFLHRLTSLFPGHFRQGVHGHQQRDGRHHGHEGAAAPAQRPQDAQERGRGAQDIREHPTQAPHQSLWSGGEQKIGALEGCLYVLQDVQSDL